jgi:hypothetical protein
MPSSKGEKAGERKILDSRSLRSGCETPLKALLFWAFSDGVFRSPYYSLLRPPLLPRGVLDSRSDVLSII